MRARGYLWKVIERSSYRFPLMTEIKLIEKFVATRAVWSACRVVFRNVGSSFLPEVKLQRGVISEIASQSLDSRGSRKRDDEVKDIDQVHVPR